jgi:hypothetical protein
VESTRGNDAGVKKPGGSRRPGLVSCDQLEAPGRFIWQLVGVLDT